MKNLTYKQLAHSNRKISEANQKRKLQFGLCLLGIVLLVCTAMFLTNTINLDALFNAGTGVIIAGVPIGFGSINGDGPNKDRLGKKVIARLWFIEKDQVDDTVDFPAAVGRNVGNITLKAGQYWNYIDAVLDSPVPKSSGTVNADYAATITNELQFLLAGFGDDVANLLENGIGRQFYIVWQLCGENDKFLGGNKCKPLTLTAFDWTSDKDKTAASLTFKNECGEVWKKYTGTTPTQAPYTVAADATTFALQANSNYQLTSGTNAAAAINAISAVTDADLNRIITLLGSGGAHPSTIAAEGAVFVLSADWIALATKQLTLKIMKNGDNYAFVEMSRV